MYFIKGMRVHTDEDFEKFQEIIWKYMPDYGEGETLASQVCTAVCKLLYKWFNDGDVYDNVHGGVKGWCNDLSSYANWLATHGFGRDVLMEIKNVKTEKDYVALLYRLCEEVIKEDELERLNTIPKNASIYDCDGYFKFVDNDDDDDDDDYYDYDDDDEDE